MSTVNVAEWEPQQRRTGSLVAIGIALVLVLVGVAVWWFADASDAIYWTLVVLLALVLVFVVLVLVLGMRAERAREPVGDAHAGPAAPGIVPPPAAATSANIATLSLRCGDCGTVFDVTDTGERPLYHTCPGCGAEGVLRAPAAPPEPEPEPARAPAAQPDSVWAAPPEREEAPAEVAPPPPTPAAPRRLKLRCGGCKEVFVIEDTGERPLRRPCPHCSRMGEIR